jgi:hypothetical protein
MANIRKHGRRRPWKIPATRGKNSPGDGVRRFKENGTPLKGWDGLATGSERDPRLKSQRWQRVRRAILSDEPLCNVCETAGRIEPAVTVDHIEPRVDDFNNFYDRFNLWSLCDKCHRVKSRLESKGVRYTERLEWVNHITAQRERTR